jgi:ketosteroid isomerase-like protein
MSAAPKPLNFYTDMIAQKYFAAVDRKDLKATLECFCEDAVFTIQSSFTVHEGRDTGIKKMFETFFTGYKTIIHKDFVHVLDPQQDRCAAQFNVVLVDNAGNTINLSNCNVHYFENGKFKRVYVYMSGPNVLL